MSDVGTICWNELNTRDLGKARQFYGDLFGWTFDATPMGDSEYLVAMQGDQMVGGIYDLNSEPLLDGIPDHWFTYVQVENIEKMVDATVKAGGEIRRPPFEVPGNMKVAVVADANGAVFGYMEQLA